MLPYAHELARFPAYLQQLDMECNGKSVRLDGTPVAVDTGPVVWGEPGTNGQHAFYQLLHQGTRWCPPTSSASPFRHHPHRSIMTCSMANLIAQTEALAFGKTEEESRTIPSAHRSPGNRPTTTIVAPD